MVGTTRVYFTALAAPCSSTDNLMLVSGGVVIWHHCQWQNTVIPCCIWVAPSVWDQVELLSLTNPPDVFLEEVIQHRPWFTNSAGWPREWFPWVQGVRQGQEQSSPLLGRRGEEVIFSTASLFSFCCHPPSHFPRLRGATKPHTRFRHASTMEGLQELSLSCTQDRPCRILPNVRRLWEVNLYFHLCAVHREYTV